MRAISPQAHPVAVAAAAIGGNDEGAGLGIARLAKAIPPAANTLDREGRRVGVDADIDPTCVGRNVAAIRGDLAEFRGLEVVDPNRFGLPLGPQLLAAVLEVADQFFLLGVDRDGRRLGRDGSFYRLVDVLELCVAIRMARALADFSREARSGDV